MAEGVTPDIDLGGDDEDGDPTVRGPHPCQAPDCDADADSATGYTYCVDHADADPAGTGNEDSGAAESGDESGAPDSSSETPAEPDVASVDLQDDDFAGGGGLFDDIEDEDDSLDDDLGGDSGGDPLDGLDDRGEALEDSVNEGMARLAVAGLADGEQSELESEFTEIFEAFRLGYFGSRTVEEYIFTPDGDEVDPAWGFFGSSMCCLALVLWMRPDGEEQISRMTDAVRGLTGAGGASL